MNETGRHGLRSPAVRPGPLASGDTAAAGIRNGCAADDAMSSVPMVTTHLQQSRLQARKLLQRAARPHVVTPTDIAFAAFALFVAAVVAGFALRVWLTASI